MDSRGWIPIPLLAEFKRVRQLTGDLHTVKDVLILSKQVEVRDDHVRMLQWAQFVLPTAPRSVIEVTDPQEGGPPGEAPAEPTLVHEDSTVTEHDEVEEEEEDVVFVLERPSTEA